MHISLAYASTKLIVTGLLSPPPCLVSHLGKVVVVKVYLDLRLLCLPCSGTAPLLPVNPSQQQQPTDSASSTAALCKVGSQDGRERIRCGLPVPPQLEQETGEGESAVDRMVSVCVNGSSHAQAKLGRAASSREQGPSDMQPDSRPLQQGLPKAEKARQQGKQPGLQAARKAGGSKLASAGRLAESAADSNSSPACCLQHIVGTALGYNYSTASAQRAALQCSSTASARQKTIATGRPKPRTGSANESGGTPTCGIMSVQGMCRSSRDQPVTPEVGPELQRRLGGRPSAKPGCTVERTAKLEKPPPFAELEDGGQPLDLQARGTSWGSSAVQLC